MPEYLSPGVYVEEVQTGPRPIEGVSTSTAGMVGRTERGPEAVSMVTSWLDFQRWYGGYLPVEKSFLPYAVQGFFDNGGQRLFIARVVALDAAFANGDASANNLHFEALGKGAWGNRIYIRISEGSKPNAANAHFRLDVMYFTEQQMPTPPANFIDPLDPAQIKTAGRIVPDKVESYDNLTHLKGASNNVEAVVNANSRLVRVWFPAAPAPVPFPVPPAAAIVQLTSGSDGELVDPAHVPPIDNRIKAPTYKGSPDDPINPDPVGGVLYGQGHGLDALANIDEISLLAVPDEIISGFEPITTEVINQCELLRDRFGIVSAKRGSAYVGLTPTTDTTYAAFYFPWIEIYDPVSNGPILVPASGHVLGLIARTDIERGVHKAPANEVVRDATNLEFAVTKGMQDILNPKGVNCVRDFRSAGRGIRLWGARTMSSDGMWKYINVRRLFIFVEESIDEGTQWVVFEPNDEPLWAQVRRSIANFLIGVWKSGALMGLTQEEAFFVKCDRTTMTQDDIDNGRLVCYIGIAPVKPAEFVIFRISQKTAEAPA